MTLEIMENNYRMMSEMLKDTEEVNRNFIIDLPLSFETKRSIEDKLNAEAMQFIQSIVNDAMVEEMSLNFDDVIRVRGQYYTCLCKKAEEEGIA